MDILGCVYEYSLLVVIKGTLAVLHVLLLPFHVEKSLIRWWFMNEPIVPGFVRWASQNGDVLAIILASVLSAVIIRALTADEILSRLSVPRAYCRHGRALAQR